MRSVYGFWSAAILTTLLVSGALGLYIIDKGGRISLAHTCLIAGIVVFLQAFLTYNLVQIVNGSLVRLIYLNPFIRNKRVLIADVKVVSITKRTVKGGGTTMIIETLAGNTFEITTVMMPFEYKRLAAGLRQMGVNVSIVKL
jgi:hypothetical protein